MNCHNTNHLKLKIKNFSTMENAEVRIEMEKIYHCIYAAYLFMRRHRITFRIVIFLRETGIQGKVKRLFRYSRAKERWNKEMINPTEEMIETRDFLKENKERIQNMLKLLEDEKSRRTWKAVMLFKAKRKPIPKKLYSTNDEYFVKGIIEIDDNEVFIDGGAYIGDSTQQLIDIARRKRKRIGKIVLFEPNPANVKIIKKLFNKNNIKLIERGLYDSETELKFELADENLNENTRIIEGNKEDLSTIFHSLEQRAYITLPVTTLDSQEECRDATFIKLCIEGSEMKALAGAKETILRNKPKLAICIYHNNDNMVRIIEYVHSLVPEYKLYVRHHTFEMDQTVLYAIL